MATDLYYLQDFDITTCSAQVTSITETEGNRTDVQLDKTCFYPRGGGQDWDTGTIGGVFQVEEVRLDQDGVVHHIGTFAGNPFAVGDMIDCVVDVDRRAINTRLHSAGHVVDLAVDQIGVGWKPGRGAHYPHMSFVEYEGSVDPEETDAIQSKIQAVVDDVIAQGSENEVKFMPVSEMHTVCRHVPENIPTNKPARVVIYNHDFGVPCGGTHVKNVKDIGKVTITKVKTKKGLTKVSYAVAGIN